MVLREGYGWVCVFARMAAPANTTSELSRLQGGDEDEGIEGKQREGREGGVEWVANSKTGKHSEEHHQGESRGGEPEQRKVEVAEKHSKAAAYLQRSGQHSETGDLIAFKFGHHLPGEEAAQTIPGECSDGDRLSDFRVNLHTG